MSGMHVEQADGTRTLTLDGSRGNALDTGRYVGIREVAESVEPDEVLHIRAEGRHFSGGQDLDEWRTHADRSELLRTGCAAVLAVLRCRGPVVTSAQGAAVGGGALLVAAADVAVVADDAWLALPELQLGLLLGASVAERLLPPATVRRMLLTGARVSAASIAGSGAAVLASRADLDATAVEQVATLRGLDPDVTASARRAWGDGERERTARAYESEVQACLDRIS
ncbi:enoyl-CoA hydratase-related protein [Nocardioides alcanivorans]|uniref:enoyl-CoA hydratase-related protein n=1 Tax=Nocardioides alcanivorans TaxID=2897352 RepID=UPI001F393833|nr:enoyl-CoA hydratase-related protein [Nocardioides alcanivorans]